MKVMKELNYRPSSAAKSLVTNSTKTIGIVVSEITRPFFREFINGIEDKLIHADYNIMYSSSHWVVEEEKKHMRLFQEGRVDGLIMVSGAIGESDDLLIEMATKDTPVVIIDRKITNEHIVQLNVDNVDAGYQGTEYLIKKGHRKIAFINGTDIASSNASADRTKGYLQAMADYNIGETFIESGAFERPEAYEATIKILKEHPDLTAIFYASDMMAIAGYKALKKMRYSVPEDISVLGVDGLEIGELVDPELSTLKQPRYEMGYLAAERLINKLTDNEDPSLPYKQIFKVDIVERESVKDLT
jgi:LacI family transcriptional regulator